tara:strand:+ start:1341 stop:1709 length:369 start_codon:yes stop_codon:yes gene_type:complete
MFLQKNRKNFISSYSKGVFYENYVILLLLLQGYSIIARRYKARCGEIDIVATRCNQIVFCEVKKRKHKKDVFDLISFKQKKRIENAISSFLKKYPKFQSYNQRIDVCLLLGILRVYWYRNAW